MRAIFSPGYQSPLSFPSPVVLENDPQEPAALSADLVAEVAEREAGDIAEAEARRAENLFRLPRRMPSVGTFYAFGDSQTAGTNSASKPYTSAGYLLADYRWPKIAANAYGLSYENFGVGGSRISWKDEAGSSRYSHFNVLGRRLPHDWTGIVAGMFGWNNLGQVGDYDPAYFARLQNAYEAVIARALIDDWCAVTTFGWTRSSAENDDTPDWAVSGCTNGQSVEVDDSFVPFSAGGVFYVHRWINIFPGQTPTAFIQFNSGSARAVVLFYETAPGGGSFHVKVNGAIVATVSTDFTAPLGDKFPGMVWLDNIPSAALVRVEHAGIGGNCIIQASGLVSKELNLGTRHILLSGPCGNDGGLNARPEPQRIAAQEAARAAVGAFSLAYPVSLVDCQTQWIESRDQEPSDTSHLTELGNYAVAEQFQRPLVPRGSSVNVIRL